MITEMKDTAHIFFYLIPGGWYLADEELEGKQKGVRMRCCCCDKHAFKGISNIQVDYMIIHLSMCFSI